MALTATVGVESKRDHFLAELTEAALVVAAKDGTCGKSVELEIDLWNSLAIALRDRARRERLDRASHHWDERLAELIDVAYRILLEHRFHHYFIDVQLDLRNAFRDVIRRNRFLPTKPASVTDTTRLSGMLAIH